MAERSTSPRASRLLGDFGGTTVRLALQSPGQAPRRVRIYEAADFPDVEAALRRYFRNVGLTARTAPRAAAIAVAGPIIGERIRMTNLPWAISLKSLRRRFDFETLLAINDFAAVAESIPYLAPKDRRKIGGGQPVARMPIVAFGPGTGLGVSALVPVLSMKNGPQAWQAVATEGGHVTLPATSQEDSAVVAELQRRFGHVSAERALSGPGLANLHAALASLQGAAPKTPLSPEAVTRAARRGDKLARSAVATFCAMLGTVAGNLALTYGAQGGIYIAGGIVPKLGPLFDAKAFRARFVAKGRYRRYLEAIPTYVITRKQPAFLGLAAALDRAATLEKSAKPPMAARRSV